MNMLLSVAVGGALGACARYGVAQLMLRYLGPGYPYGTVFVNVVGSFVMGILIELMALKWSVSPEMRVLMITGFLGAFTTFSAFSLDVALLIERGATFAAAGYILISVVFSIGALFAGLHLMRMVLT
ncbi:MAG: fluoride efflux transporter CrcB [Proteobacteria bacterium]|nr:fluoride efflux transporter CrcB [Pseudomonadota bacterium]